MSMPDFPDVNPALTREEAINQIISSIAMGELGLSHIVNTEGEKLQYALGTLTGVTGPDEPTSIDDLLKINESVRDTLESTMQNQMFLNSRLKNALEASVMRGPTGATGPVGVILDSYDSLDDLKAAHPTGNQGDAYLVAGLLYVWNSGIAPAGDWEEIGSLVGPTGPQGTGTTIRGVYNSVEDLEREHTPGNLDEAYLVNGAIYIWDDNNQVWRSGGSLLGPTGPAGAIGESGPTGPVGVVLGSYDTIDQLRAAHPTGNQGDAYLVGGMLYVWNEDIAPSGDWEEVGDLIGPEGPMGPAGADGIMGPIQGIVETIAELPDSGMQQGDMYYVRGEANPDDNGVYVWDQNLDWVQVGLVPGPRGETGPQGVATTILDSYATLEELEAQHPTGNLGDAYLVGGELYIWDVNAGATGAWRAIGSLIGPTGPTGPAGTTSTIIPFASGASRSLTSAINGERYDVCAVGFGNIYKLSGAATDPINLPIAGIDTEARQLAFSMPDDGVVTAMSGFISVASGPMAESVVIARLYYSEEPNNSFMPLEGAEIVFDPPIPALAPVGTIRSGNVRLSTPVRAGTRLLMVFYHTSIGGGSTSPALYFSGGVKIDSALP